MTMLTIFLFHSTIIDGKPTNDICAHSAPNPYLLNEHGLAVDSPPVNFVNAFMPKMKLKAEVLQQNVVQLVSQDYVPMVI